MRRVAAVDIGTNSTLLLIAEDTGQGRRVLVDRSTITRLGQGVDATGQFSPSAAECTLACLTDYAGEIRRAAVSRVAAVGTSALRDARDAGSFVAAASSALGAPVRVIDGAEEARLTFLGGLGGLAVEGSVTVFDVGGGSTEIIRGIAGPQRVGVRETASLDVGSVRLTERHVRDDPPSPTAVESMRAQVRAALKAAPRPAPGGQVVALGGTATTLVCIDRRLVVYDSSQVHGATLPVTGLLRLATHLSGLSTTERRALPGLEPARADVICAGAWILVELCAWSRADALLVSDRGVRWGLVEELGSG